MSNRVNVEAVTVSPQMALEWLTKHGYIVDDMDLQRPIRRNTVEFYAEEMRRGEFHYATMIEFGEVNGRRILLDGQHRLQAVASSGIPQVFLVKTGKYRDYDELGNAYSRIDQGAKRLTTDQLRAWGLPEKYGIGSGWTNKLSAAVRLVDAEFSGRRRRLHPADLRRMMDEYSVAMIEYHAVPKPKPMEKPMMRSSTVAVGIVTFRYSVNVFDRSRIDDFWFGVADDSGLDRRDPRKRAHEHLMYTRITGGYVRKSPVSVQFSARYLAYCFNAWVDGKDSINDPERTIDQDQFKPILIKGSPFTGK